MTDDGHISVRLMTADDFDTVVAIDDKVSKVTRTEYYELKFEKLFKSPHVLPTSMVAEDEHGTVVGFVMGELYMGEFGIYREEARLDTIGVDPDHRHKGIGGRLVKEFMEHLGQLGIQKVNTLVAWNDTALIEFFSANQFTPSTTINLERTL